MMKEKLCLITLTVAFFLWSYSTSFATSNSGNLAETSPKPSLEQSTSTSTFLSPMGTLLRAFFAAKPGEEMKAFMNKPLVRYDVYGGVKLPNEWKLGVSIGKFSRYYSEIRKNKICKTVENGDLVCANSEEDGDIRRLEKSNDDPRHLVWNGFIESGPNQYIDNLWKMHKKELREGIVTTQPWSGDYWALYAGALAFRYGDTEFPGSSWHEVAAYFAEEKVNVKSMTEEALNKLSPAEKYDIIVGDKNFSLTASQVKLAQPYAYESSGHHSRGVLEKDVEKWMGLCHGWAVASYMSKRPLKSVRAKAPNEKWITFYPDDIKALSTLKWADGKTVEIKKRRDGTKAWQLASNFIGGRCNQNFAEGNIPIDEESGAVLSDNCFDTNPSAWHKSVVNQVGIMKEPFIMDATFDYEVWNQPVLSYHYSYFNPITEEITESLESARVLMNNAVFERKDKFRKHRERRASWEGGAPKYVVGIAMEVKYIGETSSQARDTESEEYDQVTTIQYLYDLELTEDGTIVGGEWYTNLHPDFLWTPKQNAFAWNEEDRYDYNASQYKYIPEDGMRELRQNVAIEAAKKGIVLKSIVDGLIDAANK